ncbi:hypothetical protein ACJJTC_007866 [Scirpophaga incertulas]
MGSSSSSISTCSKSSREETRRYKHKKVKKHTHKKSKQDKYNSKRNKRQLDNDRCSYTPPLQTKTTAPDVHNMQHNTIQTGTNNSLPIHAFTSHLNVVPEFDPSDNSQNIESWIHKINECASIYLWNETQKCHYALAKLRALAKRWYQGLPSVLFTWDQWVEKLKAAFPSTENYGDLLQRMLQFRCKMGQPLDVYYYEKMILINKCEISGRNAVECLVHGIDDKFIRMSATLVVSKNRSNCAHT